MKIILITNNTIKEQWYYVEDKHLQREIDKAQNSNYFIKILEPKILYDSSKNKTFKYKL